MSDLISRQRVIKEIDRFIPADPMKSDYTQGISVGLAIATRCVEQFSQENHDSSQGLVKDLISRQDAIEAVEDTDWYHQNKKGEMVHGANPSDHQAWYKAEDIYNVLESLPSAEPEIIRCKDCKHHVLHPRMGVPWCRLLHSDMGDNQFCSYAERGEQE